MRYGFEPTVRLVDCEQLLKHLPNRCYPAALWLAAILAIVMTAATGARAQPEPRSDQGVAPSSAAESIYTTARPKLLQIRTLVPSAGSQSSIGSGFLVSADGLALTNYHVVSQYALEPDTYRLEYAAADGTHGALTLLAIDIADDLAIVHLDRSDSAFFEFDDAALHEGLAKGERLYSMGNPLDLGFTIVEGTHNGRVERSYSERIHFSGAINPGMSGGPAVRGSGRVVGINVAKQMSGELVSFLVPARFAVALLERARNAKGPMPNEFRAEIGRQLLAWQSSLYQSISSMGFRASAFGPYDAPESSAPWFTCWSQTNSDQLPKPRATVDTTNCSSDTRIFVANDLNVGRIVLSHSYLRSVDLNEFQFATLLSQRFQPSWPGIWVRKWQTPQSCHEDFLAGSDPEAHPPLHALWCARAYRAFQGLYDVSVVAVTQDRSGEALISRLALQGTSYDNALSLTRHFLDGLRWTR